MANRDELIKEIETLWRQVMEKDMPEMDAAINARFEVADGRDSLDGAAIEIIRAGLLKKKNNDGRAN